MLPSSSDLSYFMTIAQAGSFSAAASRLGIAQPSLSLAVQRLEGNLGTSLFVRSRQGVVLTKAGERLFADSRDLLQRWESLRADALSTTNEIRGCMKLGVHPSVAIYSLPLFLPKLLKENPDLEIMLVHDLSRAITQKVIACEVDVGIVVNPVPHGDLVIKPLAKDEVTLWQMANLKNEDVLICEPSLLQTQEILRKLAKQSRKFKRTIECSNLEVIVRMAQTGVGAAILPARVAQAQNQKLNPVIGAPKFHDEIALIYRTEQRSVKSLQALSLAIQEGFRL